MVDNISRIGGGGGTSGGSDDDTRGSDPDPAPDPEPDPDPAPPVDDIQQPAPAPPEPDPDPEPEPDPDPAPPADDIQQPAPAPPEPEPDPDPEPEPDPDPAPPADDIQQPAPAPPEPEPSPADDPTNAPSANEGDTSGDGGSTIETGGAESTSDPSPTSRAGTDRDIPDGASDGGIIDTIRDTASDTIDRATGTEADRDITDRLTTGGVLSEQRDSSDGLLPGEVGGVDISEARLREEAQETREARTERFENSAELTIGGSDLPDRVITGAAEAASEITNPAGLVTSAETAFEVGTSAPGTIADEGAGDVAATAGAVGVTAGAATVDSAQENPAEFAGGAAFNLIGGAGAGSQLGRFSRATRDRVRTAGGAEIDASDLAGEDVIRNVETDGAEGERFPGADDPDLYESDPAEAVRQQADANTPAEIDETFSDAGVEDGTTLTKALDVEPEGPGRGRADTGFSSAPGESLEEFDYETPGSFAGPELSPNFLGIGDGGGRSFSFRPGTPDTGNNPTAVLARTEVENPDADTLDEFNREMIDRSGDTTAVTKPADEVNTGEIEAVVPPGAQFRSVGSGGARGTLQRLGIGSDFYTEIGGRRVPLRTVAPDRDRGDGADSDVLDGDGPDRNTGSGGQTLDELSERVETPTDRPVPGFGVGGSDSGGSDSPSNSGGGSPFGDVSSGFDSGPGGGSGGGSPPGSGTPGPSGGPPAPGSSGGPSGSGGSGGSPLGGGAPPASNQPASPLSPFDPSPQRRSRRRSDEPSADDEDPFSYLVDEESDEFGSGILSGDEAAEQFFGR
jgi:hypothetical protein